MQLGGRLLSAREQLLVCAQPECPKLISRECTGWLSEVEDALSSVVFAVVDAQGRDVVDVRIYSDGSLLAHRAEGRAQPLDPGLHEFRFEADGYEPLHMTLPIRQSERNRIVRVQLASPPEPTRRLELRPSTPNPVQSGRRVPLASYVLGSVALAGFGAFAYFAIDGKHEYDEAKASCAPLCSERDVAAGRRAYVLADVGLGVGVAATAAAVVLFLTSGDRSESAGDRRARLLPELSPQGASLRVVGHY
jgi:hypothetical protein